MKSKKKRLGSLSEEEEKKRDEWLRETKTKKVTQVIYLRENLKKN